jgi:hypothetical protein
MARQSTADSGWDRHEADRAGTRADPCAALLEGIEDLEEQVAMLEESLPRAPGAQRAALAKEINQYREDLDAKRRVLHQCRSEHG